MSIKQSVCWWCFEPFGMAADDLLGMIKNAGYAAVELVPPDLWRLAKDHGLAIATVDGHRPLEDGLNKRENAARLQKAITERIQLAAEWNVPNVIVFSGNRNGLDDTTGAEITAENLRRVVKIAEDAGVTLILELLNSKIDHPDYQCDRTVWGVGVVDAVGSPALKLLYDIYHMQVMEGDIIHTIQTYHPYFAHYHTAGVPGRNEIDTSQELYYPAIVRAILQTGYTGYLGQEFIPKGDPRAALQAAFDLCNLA